MPSLVMSEEPGRRPSATHILRTMRPSLMQRSRLIVALLALVAVAAAAVVACDETGPSPIGEHFDDAGGDTADGPAPTVDAGDEGGEGGEGGKNDAGDAEVDAADAADAG